MEPRARTALTLAVLVVLLVGGGVWGLGAVTAPFPGSDADEEAAVCTDRRVAVGDEITPGDVTVSVYNGGAGDGTAGRTLGRLERRGFGVGETGNAPQRVRRVQVWTPTRGDAAAVLVASHLGADIVERDGLGPGTTVVVGPELDGLRRGLRSTTVEVDGTVCSPPESTLTP